MRGDPSPSDSGIGPKLPSIILSGLGGGPIRLAPSLSALSPPATKLRLMPGTLLIGLSSSASRSLAAALAIPHAGVGLSSIGLDRSSDTIRDPGDRWAWDGRTGEIMTKSSSPYLCGEGEGESRCLLLREMEKGTAKGLPGDVMRAPTFPAIPTPPPELDDPADTVEAVDRFELDDEPDEVGPKGVCRIVRRSLAGRVDDDVPPFEALENHVVGRCKALVRGILKPLADPSLGAATVEEDEAADDRAGWTVDAGMFACFAGKTLRARRVGGR